MTDIRRLVEGFLQEDNKKSIVTPTTYIPFLTLSFSATLLSEDDLSRLEFRMLEIINGERMLKGIQPYIFSEAIARVARRHSQDMIIRRFISHVSPDGLDCCQRLAKAGINPPICGENIAKHINIDKAHAGLMNSEGHRQNILDIEFTHIGIGIVQDRDQAIVITQNFIKDKTYSDVLKPPI